MKKVLAHIARHKERPKRESEGGQGLVEYMIMLALIAVAVILIINVLEPTIANVFSRFARQAPVAPPALLAYTPPATPIPTVDPSATATNTPAVPPTNTPTSTPTPTNTPTATPTATATGTPPPLTFTSIGAEDGHVQEQAESNRGGDVFVAGAIEIGDTADIHDSQKKGFLSFDTSTLPANAIIVSAQLRIRRSGIEGNPYATLNTIVADIAPANGFNGNYALEANDFQAAAANQAIALFTRALNNDDWAQANILGHGWPHINRTGRTQFRLFFTVDDNANKSHDRIYFHDGAAAAGSRPELIITYTLP